MQQCAIYLNACNTDKVVFHLKSAVACDEALLYNWSTSFTKNSLNYPGCQRFRLSKVLCYSLSDMI